MQRLSHPVIAMFVIALLLAACGSPAATPTSAPTLAAAATSPAPTAVPTPAPTKGPRIGGTLVYPISFEPDTLDVHRTPGGGSALVLQYLGASLIAKDPVTNEFIPYLAKSWSIAPDGKTLEFKLREDVKFHDGSPLTAEDYAWTINRAIDPATKSPTTAAIMRGVAKAEAVDTHTLRINMASPNFPLLQNLTDPIFSQPLSKAYFEKVGADAFGRRPIGAGPFKLKQWVTGEKVVLERNPDFNWGPAYTHGGPPYIETLEIRFIPEYATVLAGLEAGELGLATLDSKDVKRIRNSGQFQLAERLSQGTGLTVMLNVSKPPFDDVRVRQAFSLAVDRQTLVDVIRQGNARIQYGPLTPTVRGYWPGVEKIGYGFDLQKAKALMAQAGFTAASDGILRKDGAPLQLKLKAISNLPESVQVATVLQEQFKALGVTVEIEQTEAGVLTASMLKGDYNFAVTGSGWADSSLIFGLFHSSMIGGLNMSQVKDAELDKYLLQMMFAPSLEVNISAGNDAQRRIVEQAYLIPLYAPQYFTAMANWLQGVRLSPDGPTELFDAYLMK